MEFQKFMQATRILPDLQCSLMCEDIRQEVTGNLILIGVIQFLRVPERAAGQPHRRQRQRLREHGHRIGDLLGRRQSGPGGFHPARGRRQPRRQQQGRDRQTTILFRHDSMAYF